MTRLRAILFDFGGTLFDYGTTAPGERACLVELAHEAGITAEAKDVRRAYRASLKRAFYEYLPQPYYLHRDMFRDALLGTAAHFGVTFTEEQLERYRANQCQYREHDFRLRDGVTETLSALRRRGLHLGIVSNVDNDQFSQMIQLSGLEPYFDSLLTSEDVQSCKPDQAIFAEALRRAECSPREAFFVGDSLQQDIAGANRAGLRSVLIWSQAETNPSDAHAKPQHIIRSIPELLDIAA